MAMISDKDKIRALGIICGTGPSESRDAVNYCKDHSDCNEVGYIMAHSFAVVWKKGMDDKIRHYSKYSENHPCGIHWKNFLETGCIPDDLLREM